MRQVKRIKVIMSGVMLTLIPAALFAGFTSIPIRQDPRFISEYTADSYRDQLIIETISNDNTWAAWLSDVDSQHCQIVR